MTGTCVGPKGTERKFYDADGKELEALEGTRLASYIIYGDRLCLLMMNS